MIKFITQRLCRHLVTTEWQPTGECHRRTSMMLGEMEMAEFKAVCRGCGRTLKEMREMGRIGEVTECIDRLRELGIHINNPLHFTITDTDRLQVMNETVERWWGEDPNQKVVPIASR